MILNILKKIFGAKDNVVEIINENGYASNESFIMPVDDAVSIPGVGTVITGKIESGKVAIGDKIKINKSGMVKISKVAKNNKNGTKECKMRSVRRSCRNCF